jgi:hypothetical protein
MRLSSAEKIGHTREKPSSSSGLSARSGTCFAQLFLQHRNPILGVRESLLHHESALNQQVGSHRNFSDLAPDQLISFGVSSLAICRLAQPIEQTGYQIMFFWCHN